MLRAYKVFLATAYPQRELVETMKRLFACLAICASLSASAQDDNCTVLGVQELSSLYSELSASIDTIVAALSLVALNTDASIVEYTTCSDANMNYSTVIATIEDCTNDRISEGFVPLGSPQQFFKNNGSVHFCLQALVKYADD